MLFVLAMSLLLSLGSAVSALPAAAQGGNGQNGNNGDVKIHEGAGEPDPVTSEDSKVCTFHVHGFNFDSRQQVEWHVDQQAPTGTANVIPTQTATADANGSWVSGLWTLPAGHYELVMPDGSAKGKVFKSDCGTIRVMKYSDLNPNGHLDSDEPGLSGWDFTVKNGEGTTVGTITTGGSPLGQGTLLIGAGSYTIYENALPANWTNTDPGGAAPSKTVTVTDEELANIVYFGNHYSAPPTTGALTVTKYNDLDNDRTRDANEDVLSGWTFTAKDAAGAIVGTITTDASGTATLANLVPGTYSLVETTQAGWANSEPGTGTKTGLVVTAGQTANATFGNHQTVTQALLLTSMCSVDPAVSRQWRVRNANAFDVPFTWEVYETSQAGIGTALASSDVFFSTLTVSGANTTKVYWSGGETVKASGGATCAPTTGALTVTKYNDLDNDRSRDEGEGLLSGWTFTAMDAAGATVGTMTTDASGTATLANLVPGTYSLVETAKAGWTNSDPGIGTKTLEVTAGQTATATFGNHYSTPSIDGTLSVTKYNDLDEDGSRDLPNGTAGEPGLSGWNFTVQLLIEGMPSGDSQTIATGTDPLGEVTITLAHGQYRVCEVLPLATGWSFTDPKTDTPCKDVNVSTNEQTTVSFGNHYTAPPTTGSLSVTKYNDLDNDGRRDENEGLLSGWTFTATNAAGATVGTMTTDASGTATLANLVPGTYSLIETAKAGWTNSDPGGGTKTGLAVTAGQTATATFGNHYTAPPQNGSLRVFKYNDLDNNGQQGGAGESGLSQWSFTVVPVFEVTGLQLQSFDLVTGSDVLGFSQYLSLAPGTYRVCENTPLPANWTNTDPGDGYCKTVDLEAGTSVTISFGNHYTYTPPTPRGTLNITKYHDHDADGTRDPGDPGLSGWTFEIRSGGFTFTTITTGSDGTAALTLGAGTYTVVEVPQLGWTSVDPGGTAPTKTVTISDGQVTSIVFGNAQVILPPTSQTQIVVFKYADANANGKRDDGENGLAGFTFLIRSDSGAIVASAETDDFGLATITNLPLGGYTVIEQQRSGWFNTDPGGAAQKFVVLTSTGLIADVSFGNVQVRLPSTSTAGDDGGAPWMLLFVLGLGLTLTIAQRAREER